MEQIILPGVIESHDPIWDFLDRWIERAGLDSKAQGRLHLAVDELVTNIVTHGYEEHGLSGDIIIQAEVTPEALTIIIEDTAVPFDPRTLSKPASVDQSLEERPIGGLGVYLMFRSVDRYEYRHVDGKNQNVFIVNRSSPRSGSAV